MKTIKIILLAIIIAGIAGCSWFSREEYRQATALPPLEVPPGLTTPPSDDRLAVPNLPSGRVSAVATARQNQDGPTQASRRPVTNVARREPQDTWLSGEPGRDRLAALEEDSVLQAPQSAQETSQSYNLTGSSGGLQIIEGLPVLVIAEPFERVWQRTGAALERIGLAVEDQDPAQGVFYVRYQGPVNGKTGPFGELFDGDNGLTPGSRYSVYLLKQGEQTLITAHAEQPLEKNTAENILKLITAALQDGATGSG